MKSAKNIGRRPVIRAVAESLMQHRTQFALEVFENKVFLLIITLCEVDIAPLWDKGGADRLQTHTNRGRQEEWYKDYWLLQLRRSWRSWLSRAARTEHRCNFPRMQQHSSMSISTNWCTRTNFFGRACGPVRSFPMLRGRSNG